MNPPKLYFVLALTAVMAANVYGQVLDLDGNYMLNDSSYYVLPVASNRGGGLTLRPLVSQFCPPGIAQEYLESMNGIPVKFSNWKSEGRSVPLSEDLNIQMDIPITANIPITTCLEPTYWQVDKFDEQRKQYFIVAGPKPQGDSVVMSFFKIEKVDLTYKFVFCPSNYAGSNCGDVKIFVDEFGDRRLALSNETYLVQFQKA